MVFGLIGILSDAHGNFGAFNKAIALLQRLGAEKFIFLGDALGYFSNTDILDRIALLGSRIACILGNHEDLIIRKFFQDKLESVYQHRSIYKTLTENQLQMIQAWPTSLKIKTQAGKVLCVHGSPKNETYEYVYPDTDLKHFSVRQDFVFMGHTHRPFIKKIDKTTFVNVGSCGLPRDHGTYGSAVLFNDETGDIHLIRFNIKKITQEWMQSLQYVHESIYSLFNKNSKKIEGMIIDE